MKKRLEAKYCVWTILLGTLLVLTGTVRADSSLLRVLTKDLGDGNRLVMIGTVDKAPHPKSSALPSDMGFKGPDADNPDFAPDFLITASPEGAHQIYSFALNSKEKDNKGSLPQPLIDLDHPKRDTFKAAPVTNAFEITRNVLSYAALSPLFRAWRIFGPQGEAKKRKQWQTLESIVQDSLNYRGPDLDPLVKAFDSKGVSGAQVLQDMTGKLNMRYQEGKIRMVLNGQNELIRRETVGQAARVDRANGHDRKVKADAMKEGLEVRRLSPSFNMLLYKCGTAIDSNFWANIRLDLPLKADTLRKQVEGYCKKDGDEIPLGIYSLGRNSNPVKVIDFMSPNRQRNGALFESLVALGTASVEAGVPVAADFIDYGESAMEGAFEFFGSDLFNGRERDYSALQAQTRSGGMDVDLQGVVRDVLLDNLKVVSNLSPEQRSYYEKGIRDGDAAVVREALGVIGSHQDGIRVIRSGDKVREQIEKNRAKNLDALERFLARDGESQKMSTDLTARAGKRVDDAAEKNRRLDAASAGGCMSARPPVVLFVVDGMNAARVQSTSSDPRFPTLASALSREPAGEARRVAQSIDLSGDVSDVCTDSGSFPQGWTNDAWDFIWETGQEQAPYPGRVVLLRPQRLGGSYDLAKQIRKNPGSCGVVIYRMDGIDHDEHGKERDSDASLARADISMKKVLDAAQHDPCLKKAQIHIVTDKADDPKAQPKARAVASRQEKAEPANEAPKEPTPQCTGECPAGPAK